MPEGFHPPLEEYLEAIHELGEEGIVVIQARLAERLGHSAPAVSEMIRRLRDAGYVEVRGRIAAADRHGPGPGRERGAQAPTRRAAAHRHHRLALGKGPSRSGPLGARHLRRGRGPARRGARPPDHLPARQPHSRVRRLGARISTALSASHRGDHVRLERVTEQVEIDPDSLAYLSAHGFMPGTEATVASRAPDGTLTLDLGARTIALGPSLGQQLFVTAA